MRLLHCNLGSHAIFVPILTALSSISMSTTTGGGIDGKVKKNQDQYEDKDKEEDGRTEF